ncbi:hypothetical protein [Facilibium subflavum]|uniref:hypothetical protein n=1 Tax=Facilibium subflavum TaxID=2219058 RepID=UPI000E65B23D|nr:hypothetical protein [Facilibium subflavum]
MRKISFFILNGISSLVFASNNYEDLIKLNVKAADASQNLFLDGSRVTISKIDNNKKYSSYVSYISCDKYCSVTFDKFKVTKRENYKIVIIKNKEVIYTNNLILIPGKYQPVTNFVSNFSLPDASLLYGKAANNIIETGRVGVGFGELLVGLGVTSLNAPIAIAAGLFFMGVGIYALYYNNTYSSTEEREFKLLKEVSNKLAEMKSDISNIQSTLNEFFKIYRYNELLKQHRNLIRNINKIDSVYNQVDNALFFRCYNNSEKNINNYDDEYVKNLFANLKGFTELGKYSKEALDDFNDISQKMLMDLKYQYDNLPKNSDYRNIFEKYNSILLKYVINVSLAIKKAYLLNQRAMLIIKKNPNYANKILIGDEITGYTFDKRMQSLKKIYKEKIDMIKNIKDTMSIPASSFNILNMCYPGQEFLDSDDYAILYSMKDDDDNAWIFTYNTKNISNNVKITKVNNTDFIRYRNGPYFKRDNYIINNKLSDKDNICVSKDDKQDAQCVLYIDKNVLDSRLKTAIKQTAIIAQLTI